jgi:probable HAF family extracellular repeat protein
MHTRSTYSAAIALIVAAGTAGAQTKYSAVDLGYLPGPVGPAHPTVGYGLNNAGTVVGQSYVTDQDQHAFSYSNGKMTDITPKGSAYTGAFGVNNAGVVVGTIFTNGNNLPFAYSGGVLNTFTVTDHMVKLAGACTAYAINDNGIVCGTGYQNYGSAQEPYYAFFYDLANNNASVVDVVEGTAAMSINNSNLACGTFALNSSGTSLGAILCTYYPQTNANSMGGFGAPGQGWIDKFAAINNLGTVVGYYSDPGTNQGVNAFSFNGTYTLLGTLSGSGNASAEAVNDFGTIVGQSQAAGGAYHAYVYYNGVMNDLNSQLARTVGTVLVDAKAINELGQIVAIGADGHTYLLTPISTILKSVSIAPTSVVAGSSCKATIALSEVQKSPVTVQLLNYTPAAATTAVSSVTIPAGAKTGTFDVNTFGVHQPTQAAIYASVGDVGVGAGVTVDPVGVKSVTLIPATVTGMSFAIGVVTLSAPAPAPGDTEVTLSVSNPSIAFLDASLVVVPQGYTEIAFCVFTEAVSKSTKVTISAVANGIGSSTNLTVKP